MLEVEFEPPKDSGPCGCCGNVTTTLIRYFYQDDDAHAVYYVRYTKAHPEKYMTFLICLGEYGEGSDASTRISFVQHARKYHGNIEFMFVDADQSPWPESEITGNILNRPEALIHPWKPQVLQITDHIILYDKEVIQFLNLV
jgi:hypothetical protein